MNVGYGLECEEGEVDLGWDGAMIGIVVIPMDACHLNHIVLRKLHLYHMNQLEIYYKVIFLQRLVI